MCSLVLMMHFVALRKTGTYFSSISSTRTLIVSNDCCYHISTWSVKLTIWNVNYKSHSREMFRDFNVFKQLVR